jgi:integrase
MAERIPEALSNEELRAIYAQPNERTVTGKRDKQRRVCVSEQLCDKLEAWLESRHGLGCNGRGPVFVTIKGSKGAAGQPLALRTVQNLLKRLADAAGIGSRSHHTICGTRLRHGTCATG